MSVFCDRKECKNSFYEHIKVAPWGNKCIPDVDHLKIIKPSKCNILLH